MNTMPDKKLRFVPDPIVTSYMQEVKRIPTLRPEEERKVLARIKAGDRRARNELVQANLRFVVSIAYGYLNRGLPLADLINEGNLGLLKAAERFEPEHDVRFISYAVWWIRQAISTALPRQTGSITVPVHRVTEAYRVRKADRLLTQRLGRAPRAEELMAETGLGMDAVTELGEMLSARQSAANESTGRQDAFEGLAEAEASPDERAYAWLLRKDLDHVLAALNPRELKVVKRFYGIDCGSPYSLAEIGSSVGLTRERVRQIKEKSIQKLRLASRLRDLAAAA